MLDITTGVGEPGSCGRANGGGPREDTTEDDDASVLDALPAPARVIAEALGMAGLVAIAVAISAALTG